MTSITPIDPRELGAPRGYANGMLVRGDHDLLFVAGQIGWDAEQRLVSATFAGQFERALANVLTVVRAAGGAPPHVVRLTIYVTAKSAYLAALREVGATYRDQMGRHYPAMSLVEVQDLLEPGALVEIEATAALPREENR